MENCLAFFLENTKCERIQSEIGQKWIAFGRIKLNTV